MILKWLPSPFPLHHHNKAHLQLGNSEWFIYGLDYPMAVESVTINTGTAFTDFNGIEMTLKDSALSLPYRVDKGYMFKQIKAYEAKK